MKKLIFAAMLFAATSLESFAGPIVSIHFQIGRKSIGCEKFGLCDPGIDVSWKLSTMQINEQENVLQITIAKEMTKGKEEYFKGNTVTFEETVVLPSDVLKALGAKTKIAIETGTYALVKTRNGYQINVPL